MGLGRMKAIDRHAIEEGYRFYSYGDSRLLIPKAAIPNISTLPTRPRWYCIR